MVTVIRVFGAVAAGASATQVLLLTYPGDAISQTVLIVVGCVAAGAGAVAAFLSRPAPAVE